ncbi:MAG: MBL fold hydrolase [Candidatus Aminicenantes bacterium RBG_13_63_10]|nr:MAG: MBL fold hydrolase [Candidatus Aminicenantes bacterium RBG_13_63_10]
MKPRTITESVRWMGAEDWDRRLFDGLIPLPDGTSYNSYLVRGSEKTALLDTVDPSQAEVLMSQLEDVPRLDYLIAHHAEQDHSGSIPRVLAKYPQAKVVATPKCVSMLQDLLLIPPDKFVPVADGETLSLGDKTLEFIHTPWVHWPETMCTFLAQDKLLFSCDFFGSHIAGTDLYADDEGRVYEAAKRYFAEIMMPFAGVIRQNLAKVKARSPRLIAPSHGPVYRRPEFILEAYEDWLSDSPRNVAVIPFISMHGSTEIMVDRLVTGLDSRGVSVHRFNMADSDIGKLAMTLVDAATIVLATPTVHAGGHPKVLYAALLANALRPKAKWVSVIGSFGWHSKAVEQIAGMIPNLKAEVLPPVMAKGYPRPEHFQELERLAEAIAERHRTLRR